MDEVDPGTVLFTLTSRSMPVINSFVAYRDSVGNLTNYKVEKAIIEVQQVAGVPDDASPPTSAGFETYYTARGKIEVSVVP